MIGMNGDPKVRPRVSTHIFTREQVARPGFVTQMEARK
jgi:hypothetical protein